MSYLCFWIIIIIIIGYELHCLLTVGDYLSCVFGCYLYLLSFDLVSSGLEALSGWVISGLV